MYVLYTAKQKMPKGAEPGKNNPSILEHPNHLVVSNNFIGFETQKGMAWIWWSSPVGLSMRKEHVKAKTCSQMLYTMSTCFIQTNGDRSQLGNQNYWLDVMSI